MSKAFIASVIQESAELTGAAATRAAGDLMQAMRQELKKAVRQNKAVRRHVCRADGSDPHNVTRRQQQSETSM